MPDQKVFDLATLQRRQEETGKPYLEFLHVTSMSSGVYILPAGGMDTQKPHRQDEMYYVVGGRGRMRAGGEDKAVAAGAVIFVAAGIEHGFYDIEEELTVIVFFAPAEM